MAKQYPLVSDFVRAEPGYGALLLSVATQVIASRNKLGEEALEEFAEGFLAHLYQKVEERPTIYVEGEDWGQHFSETMRLVAKSPPDDR